MGVSVSAREREMKRFTFLPWLGNRAAAMRGREVTWGEKRSWHRCSWDRDGIKRCLAECPPPSFSRPLLSQVENAFVAFQSFANASHASHPSLSPTHPRILPLPRVCCVSLSSLSLPFRSLHPSSALSGEDGHPDGHLGKTWEIVVGVSLSASFMSLYVLSPLIPSSRSSALWGNSHDNPRYNTSTKAEASATATA